MNPLTTTLNAIRKHSPCQTGWQKLLDYLGKTKADDDPLLLETILDSNGIDDAIWCLRAFGPEHYRTCRLFAVWCARKVQHLMTDPRSIVAVDVAERHANGLATNNELYAARNSARNAAMDAARVAAMDAARNAAMDAARNAAMDAARNAAMDAAWDAARYAAMDAARAAAWDVARVAAWDAQSKKFRDICRSGEWS